MVSTTELSSPVEPVLSTMAIEEAVEETSTVASRGDILESLTESMCS